MSTTLLVLAGLVLLGLGYEAWARARDRRRWPHPGRMVDVGGHALHVRSFGEGDIPVVFEADEGAWSTHWGRLPEDLGSVHAAIAYDRAGLGWSEPGPPPRDAETLARELHQLLARIAPGRPAVLVGHGTAAHILRAYAHRYPFETAGLVLVDPYHDGIADRLRREHIPPATPSPVLLKLTSLLGSLGVLRVLGSRASGNHRLALTDRQRAMIDALELAPRVRRGAAEELAAEPQSLRYLAKLGGIGEVPMCVIASTQTLGEQDVPQGFPRESYNAIWEQESARFLDLSAFATRVLVEGSGHQLQLERPEVVLQAILDIVDQAIELRARRARENEVPRTAPGSFEERA